MLYLRRYFSVLLGQLTTPMAQSLARTVAVWAALILFALCGMADFKALAKSLFFILLANAGLVTVVAMLAGSRLASRFAIVANGAILVHSCIEGFLYFQYGMTFRDSAVMDALGATNADETMEFLVHYWPALAIVTTLGVLAIAFILWVEKCLPTALAPSRIPASALGGVLAVLFMALHFNPTMRAENPFFYWPRYYRVCQESARQLDAMRAELAAGRTNNVEAVSYAGPEKHTVVLVVSESVNRANLSLYGYQRKTTPKLDARRQNLLVFGDVVSSDAATIQSVIKMLTPATLGKPQFDLARPSVLAQARQAGYEVHWISNQQRNDGAIQMLAEQADYSVFINKRTGRNATSLDEGLLPHLSRVLHRPAPKKFIVVHLMGAHLHYDLRYPKPFARFQDADDRVEVSMKAASRPFWIRNARNIYDNAILYGDHVLDAVLAKLQSAAGEEAASLLYVSDHGQEVGHSRNFSGHSATDASGYEIPLIMWTNREDKVAAAPRDALEARPYQADVLDHTLVGLLDIRTASYQPADDLLSAAFKPPARFLNGRSYSPRSTDTQNITATLARNN
jgi:heptose-I-phosphate ethanolaminephosphotransferase